MGSRVMVKRKREIMVKDKILYMVNILHPPLVVRLAISLNEHFVILEKTAKNNLKRRYQINPSKYACNGKMFGCKW